MNPLTSLVWPIRRFPRALALLLLGTLFLSATPALHAQSQEDLKSAFIYNFAKFTTWPAANGSAPIRVVFVNSDTLAAAFANVTKGKNVNGRDLLISKGAADAADAADILVVDNPASFAPVIAATRGKPVLTIGAEGLIGAGGMIDLVLGGGKVGFVVDVGAVKTAGLKVEPKLLKIAKSVKGE